MRRIMLMLLLFLPWLMLQGQQPRHKERRSNEQGISSFIELFTKLEQNWTMSLQKQDKAALDKLLAPEFILRTAADPEHVITRSDWLNDIVPMYKIDSFKQREMIVRVFPGDIALVSFIQLQQATVGKVNENGEFLIVDVWVGNRERQTWQAAQRYWALVRVPR